MCSRVTFSKSCSRGVVQMPPNSTAAGLIRSLLLALLEVEGRAVFGAGEDVDSPFSVRVEPEDIQHRLLSRRPALLEDLIQGAKRAQEQAGIRRLESDEAPEILLKAVSAQGVRLNELAGAALLHRVILGVNRQIRPVSRLEVQVIRAPKRRISARCTAPCNARPVPG